METDWSRALVGGATTVVLAAALFLFGWSVAVRWLPPDVRPSVRWSGAAIVSFTFITLLFWLLALMGLFRLAVVVPLAVASAAFAWRSAARATSPKSLLYNDLRAIGGVAREVLRSPAGWVLGAVTLVVAFAVVRGLMAPPLDWDGLTYHLVKAGRFVQVGALVTEQAPDAWQYYEYFPLGGDLQWAWALLPFRDGLLIALVSALQWLGAVVGLYASARELGAGPSRATAVATSIAALPAVVVFLSSSYVDNLTLTFFALGSVFVLRVLGGAVAEAPFAAAALGCMVGVRVTTLPLLGLAGLLLPWAIARSRVPRRRKTLLLATSLAVTLVGSPSYLRAWWEKGSPLHPLRVVVAGHEISRGEPELERTLADQIWRTPVARPDQPRWSQLLHAPRQKFGWYANLGPGVALLPLVAAAGTFGLLRRRRWGALAWLLVAAGVMLGALWTSEMAVYRVSHWSHTVGRLLLPGLAALALLAAGGSGPRGEKLVAAWLALASALGLVWALPRGFSGAELGGLLAALGVFAFGLAVLGVLVAWARRGGRPVQVGLAVMLVGTVALASLDRARSRQRYLLYEDAAQLFGQIYFLHPLQKRYSAAWPIWRELDRREPLRLAVFAGWDGRGHNNYRYPLLGSQLQNEVRYVPITADGSIVNSRDRCQVEDRADRDAWLGRLVDQKIDVVVALAPTIGIESEWVESSPELFELLAIGGENSAVAYRFRRDRLVGEP